MSLRVSLRAASYRWAVLLGVLTLAATAAHGEIVTRTVDYEHDGTTLQGYLAYDDQLQTEAPGGLPGVLIIPEWWGVNDYVRGRARQVAELGYVAFVADMYGQGRSTNDPQQAGQWAGAVRGDRAILRGRAEAALDVLSQQEQVDDDRLAAMSCNATRW